jgi:hypothetical protein
MSLGCHYYNKVLLCWLGPMLRGCCLQGVQPLHDLLLLVQQLLHGPQQLASQCIHLAFKPLHSKHHSIRAAAAAAAANTCVRIGRCQSTSSSSRCAGCGGTLHLAVLMLLLYLLLLLLLLRLLLLLLLLLLLFLQLQQHAFRHHG